MVRHKEQKVGVFIDVQNMYYSAKQLYDSKVDFTQILNEAVVGRRLIRAVAYAIRADIKEESQFYDALINIGFEVRLKDLQIFFGGAKKGDWDIGLAMDVVRMASKLDVVVLVSGDGDFKEMLEYVKANGCRAEVIAFGKTSSSKLKEEADLFIDMDRDLKRFLIRKRQIRKNRPHRMPVKGHAITKPTAVKPTAAKPTAAKPTAAKPTAAKPTAKFVKRPVPAKAVPVNVTNPSPPPKL